MSLEAGRRLGPYEIISPLGAGGMGEVYKAKDTRLERTVAIKVLPPHLSSNEEVRKRLEREARTVSSLSHPHICALHDVGREGEIDYLVMEYLEGETLAERLTKGALPIEQVLKLGTEMAEALDTAHRHGVVHRDLKPGNVMLTKSGVKLLDFGLAKPRPVPVNPELSRLATEAPVQPLTEKGTILGTVPYMAPEQLEGKEADARTDLFAFGAVLFEMATGRRAFDGKSQASLIAAILTSEPPSISTLQPITPPAFDRLVRTCLAKEPDDRWQSAHDVASELKWIAEGGSQAGMAVPVVARRRSRERLAWGVALSAALLALGAILRAYSRSPKPTSSLEVNAAILPPEGTAFQRAPGLMALSQDGRRLVFVATQAQGNALLWIRSLAAAAAEPLAGTEHASFPFWSPDGRFVGFFADGELKKIKADGGPAQTICAAPAARGGAWSRDGVILFAPSFGERIYRVAAAGGEPIAVTRRDPKRQDFTHRWPVFLPDGQHFLFFVRQGGGLGRKLGGIAVASLAGGEPKLLLQEASNTAYSAGHLLFLREGNLLAQPFDLDRLEMSGEAFPVAEHLKFLKPFDLADFTACERGALVYRTDARHPSQLLWFDRAGRQLSVVDKPADFARPRLATDGRSLAVVRSDPRTDEGDLWLYDTARGGATRLTFDPAWFTGAIWSPDSKRIVYGDGRRLFEKAASGSPKETILFTSNTFVGPSDWSPDGRFLTMVQLDPKTGWDLWGVPLTGERKPFVLVQTPFNEVGGLFSPDGRWIAYTSNESGRLEVYVRAFQGEGGPWQVSRSGGSTPRWRQDGRELYYVGGTRIMAVEVKNGPTLEFGAPNALFEVAIAGDPVTALEYDVTADGRRFLVNVPDQRPESPALTLLTNWRSSLGR